MAITIQFLRPRDESVVASVAAGVFDHPLDPRLLREFLDDPRHHLAVALDDGLVVGFASALHYVHPDKPPELWINEVGVAERYRRQGLAKRLLAALFELAAGLDCRQAWVLTDRDNQAATRLYRSAGGVQDEGRTLMFSFELGASRRAAGSGLAAAAQEHRREQEASAHDQERAADPGGGGGVRGAEEP